ncbi:SdrD B-like domain-containing protein [Undibacterium sp. Ren11W]|uniref:SdrD B-like domain-containing protein n=1 Tax=Undibacterium sp. Ren11W TaxID=3413045 RepID=UPI003BF234CF
MNTIAYFLNFIRTFNFSFGSNIWREQRMRSYGFFCSVLLATSFLGITQAQAQAQVVATSVTSVTDLGRDQIVNVSINWSRTLAGSGDKIIIPIPVQLTVNPPSPPAGCVYTAPSMVCDVPDGISGDNGTINFSVKGLSLGGFNLTATGTSPPAATFSGTVRSTGDIVVGKAKTSPAGNPITGGTIVFTLTPRINSGDDVPIGASVIVTDNLPGTSTDFSLGSVNFTGLSPSCNATVSANTTRTLTCTYSGAFTLAQLNASSIVLTGTPGNNGSFTNTVSIASGNSNYFDAEPSNNIANVNYVVDPGTDIQALGSFPSAAQIIGSSQSLTLTHKNNGPLNSPANGIVETIVPATFTIGVLPAGCTQTAAQSLTVGATTYNGTLVSCTVGALLVGAQQSFIIPLTMPAAPEASSFPVVVLPPPGRADTNMGNNSILLPYQIVNPFADLRASKSKSPGGPQPSGTVVTSTLTVHNDGASPSAAAYDATHPLRIVDYARPEEVDGGIVSGVTPGWICTVATGIVAPVFIADVNKTTRIACEKAGPGSLAIGASDAVSFTSTIAPVAAPIELTNRACTGSQALTALGLADTDGPQPPDGGRTANDCADAGTGLIATPVVSGKAQVSIKKESSVDNATYFDLVANAPTLAGPATTLYWRITVTTPSVAVNAIQETIPTLFVTDNIPGIVNVVTTGSPAPSYQTPAITVTTTPNTFGSCANIAAGSAALTCNFSNVPAGTTIVIDVPVSRALTGGTLTNTATLTSPNAILTAPAGGQLNDNAAVNVVPVVDVALTTKTVTPAVPSIGQIITFTITAQNLGLANITGNSQFTIADTLNTGVPTLVVPAYDIISVTPSNPAKISCAASNIVTGAISCTNTAQINRYETQTISIQARVKKPAGIGGAANSVLYSNVVNTAFVTLDPSYCEFKTETATNGSVSAACNDAASTSNNSKSVTFDIKVPAIDLQQGKVAVYPAGQSQFLIGDQLRYRFSVRNAGPSRAEDVIMTDILTVPAGFHVSMAAVMPDRLNLAPASSGYALVSKAVVCTQSAADANVICKLDAVVAKSFLDAGQEVNFEIAMDMSGTATGPVTFGNKVFVCADETNVYESSGKCSSDPALAGNNLGAVNNVVFPKADLEVVSKTTVTASPVDIAQPVEYAIVLRNNGTATTPKMRLVDTLPTGFEWINSGAQLPVASVTTGSAATLSGALVVANAVPANGTDNVCFISNGIINVTTLAQQQDITCDIGGIFPPGVANTITLKLFARAKPGLYDGSAPNALYLVNRTNNASIFPGKDATGTEISVDNNPANNTKTATVQVQGAKIAGRVFLDLNNNGDQDDTTLITDQGIGGVTITLTGTDKYGNAVSRSVTSSSVAAGPISLRGDYLFDNLTPSDAAGYTITETQPAAYGNGAPQANTARAVRNATSSNVTPNGASYGASNTASTSVLSGIVLAGGANGVQFDFPETQRPYLSGFVYLDANNDGVKDPADAGINGVTMTLIGCSSGPNGVLDTPGPIGAGPAVCAGDDRVVSKTLVTATDATYGAGYYQFALDEPGRYTVIQQAAQPAVAGVVSLRGKTTAGTVGLVTSPPGSNDGGTRGKVNTTASNVGGTAGVLQEVNSTVAASQLRDVVINNSAAISINNNFGEILPASIAGVVYTERGVLNSNYTLGGDWPFPGVSLTLTGTDDLGQAVSLTTTTLGDGSYVFNNLRPGTVYQVLKTNPSPAVINEVGGAFPGKDVANVVRGARLNDNTITAIALVSGTKVTRTNFAVTNGPEPIAPPSFQIVKNHLGDIQSGKSAVYTLKLTNVGSSASTDVLHFSDLLPVGMSLSASNPLLASSGIISGVIVNGQMVTFWLTPIAPITAGQSLTITVNVDVAATASGTLLNYAAVGGGGEPFVELPAGPACNDVNHCSKDPVTIAPPIPPAIKPTLKLTKTRSGSLVVGKPGVYVLTIANTGSVASVGSLTLSDLLPNGMSLISVNPIISVAGAIDKLTVNGQLVKFEFTPTVALEAGKSVAITVNVNVASAAVGNVINYASLNDDPLVDMPPGPACGNVEHCSSDATVIKGPPVLTLTKSAPAVFSLGGTGDYVLTIKNQGESATDGVLHLIEKLPAGLSLNAAMTSKDGVISNVLSSGNVTDGVLLHFDFTPSQPLIAINGINSITVPVSVGLTTISGVITNYASVGGGGDPRDNGNPPNPGVNCVDLRCANAPSTVTGNAMLTISKTASKTEAELGDMVTYTVTIANIGNSPVPQPNIIDRLPAGFRLIDNSSHVTGAKLMMLQGAPGAQLTYVLDSINPGKSVTISYRVRLGVGSMQGDGVNRVYAQCPYNSNQNCSNEARARVRVTGGVFTNNACITGAIYVDCNGNQIKDKEELGISGVRMYVEDGTFLISDSEGKYSYCGLSPKTHVLKVDQTTLPRGSRMVTSSNRNVGDANSLFLDLKNGELQRADFIEGSCSNTVLEQVKARRTQGEISAPHTEKKGGDALIFEGKAANHPQEGSDSANQRIVKPRTDSASSKKAVLETDSERDTPVQRLEINQGARRAN